ncbi:MAG: hypothetical protein ACREHF_09205 [Rhizomicrobium sp.]
MVFSASKLLRGAALVLVLASVAGCNQQKNTREKFAGHSGLRTACAADIQKYCADEPRKRRCLRENTEKLSDGCKAALSQRGMGRGGRRRTGGNE